MEDPELRPAAASAPEAAEEYVFRFDRAVEPLVFGDEAALSGWLLHREGKPIHGIRAIVKRRFARDQIQRARRKRNRPDVAAAFPNVTGAEVSGFLLELRLGLGRNRLTFQVLDHDRRWRTFAQATVTAFPLTLLTRSGLKEVRSFLIGYLPRFFGNEHRAETRASPGRAPAVIDALSPPQRVDLFATSKSNLFILEIGQLVAAGFRDLGCDARLHLDVVPAENPDPDTLQIVVTPHEYYNLFLTEKVSRLHAQALTRSVYLLCTEQPETGWFQSNLHWAYYSLGISDISPLTVAAYRRHGLNAQQLQLGYHSMLAHPDRVPHGERRYDITFLGSMSDRRELFFARHGDFFATHHSHLRLVPLGFAKTEKTRSYLSVERRNELLSQSRILLNLHYSEQKYFEWHRMLVGLANGCCVISETCRGYGPLVPGKHFVMVEPEHLIATCDYFLTHPEECARIAAAGREFVESQLGQAQMCREFLARIQSPEQGLSAFDLSEDAPAEPLPPALRKRLARETRRTFASALAADWRVIRGHAEPAAEISAQPTPPSPGARAAVIKNREAYGRRMLEQESLRAAGEPVWTIYDNEAYSRSSTPELSVVITLYNYAQHIDECIASVTEAAAHLRQAPEILIVNDASTDDSLMRALEYARTSLLPMRIVDKKFNTGLADARNTGTEIARAGYLFMLDADNLVFPEALKQLLAAISEGEHVAAYSLLCRFRGEPTNRVGLLSYFDWDPEILTQFPYIDAMAMFSREALLEAGGYDNHLSQVGWFGWEDYELWLRVAQRGGSVAFVPNTLCLYRHHDTSMIKTTNLFESELVQHLKERYGQMLKNYEPRERAFGVARAKVMAPDDNPESLFEPAESHVPLS